MSFWGASSFDLVALFVFSITLRRKQGARVQVNSHGLNFQLWFNGIWNPQHMRCQFDFCLLATPKLLLARQAHPKLVHFFEPKPSLNVTRLGHQALVPPKTQTSLNWINPINQGAAPPRSPSSALLPTFLGEGSLLKQTKMKRVGTNLF